MSVNSFIKHELLHERKTRSKVEALLRSTPKGILHSKLSRGKRYYTRVLPSGTSYIGNPRADSKDPDHIKRHALVEGLKKRHCLELMKHALDKDIKLLQLLETNFVDYDPNQIIDSLKGTYADAPRDTIHQTGFPDYSEWMLSSGENSFKKDGKVHSTGFGLKVRSRAELAIAELYKSKGVKAVYEKELRLPDGTILHPDFTIYLEGKNRVIYHEHLGLLNNKEYLESFSWKLKQYINAGIYPNRDLLLTCDEPDGSLDLEKLGIIIDTFIK